MAASNTHQSTHIPSSTFPNLAVRFIGPRDGAPFADIISIPGASVPDNTVIDEEWGHGAVRRIDDHAVQNPTVTDEHGQVVRGPGKASLFIVEGIEPIGIAGFGCIQTWEKDGKSVRAGDAGVVLRVDKRGKGYATEGMKLTLDFGAAPVSEGGLQLDILTVTTLEDNKAMLKVIERLGFGAERAVLRPAEFGKDKQEWYFEIPAAEWKEKRSQK